MKPVWISKVEQWWLGRKYGPNYRPPHKYPR